jgi:hypothetical protein
MSVNAALFRLYRPILLWFAGALILGEILLVSIITTFGHLGFSPWLLADGSATRFWLLIVAIMLVTTTLRQFVAHGVTRREFLAGAALGILVFAVLLAALVPVGHGLESAVLSLTGHEAAGYPAFSARLGAQEFGRALPSLLGYAVSGGLFAIVFHRFPAWIALLMLIPAAAPLMVSGGLLGYDEHGGLSDLLPYPLALAISLLVTGADAAWLWWSARDVPIWRTAG